MVGRDVFAVREVGDGARGFQDAVMGAGGEVQIFHRHAQEVLGVSAEGAEFSHLLRAHPAVDAYLAACAETHALFFAHAHDAFADGGAGLGAFGAAEFVECDGGGFDVEIDSIKQRAGDALAIFFHLLRRAAALAFWVAVETARVRIPATVTTA